MHMKNQTEDRKKEKKRRGCEGEKKKLVGVIP